MKRLAVGLAVVTVLVGVRQSEIHAEKLYWTEYHQPSGSMGVHRANLDGTQPELLFYGISAHDIAVDPVEGKLYWGQGGFNIQRANLDGTDIEDLVTGATIRAMALDSSGGKIYWSEAPPKIRRANLDGSDAEDIVPGGILDFHSFFGVALELDAGEVYWLVEESVPGAIWRRNMDGTGNAERIIYSSSGQKHDSGSRLAIDTVTSTVYWADSNNIWRNNLVTDSPGSWELVVSGINNRSGLALDTVNGWIYWAALSDDKIVRSRLDGSDQQDVLTGLQGPQAITIAPIPEPSTLILLTTGALALTVGWWRRRRAA